MDCKEYKNRWASANIRFHILRKTLMPIIKPHPFPIGQPPVVIGAMGGSGTRIIVTILQKIGYWMGSCINPNTKDAMATRYILQKSFKRLVEMGEKPDKELVEQFSKLIRLHRLGIPDPNGLWGWKNPRSMWIIPFLSSLYPEMKFIHMIRNGRDMALSGNLNLLTKHGHYLLKDINYYCNIQEAQLRIWALGNKTAWNAGQKHLGANYYLLSYERLCFSPSSELLKLFLFLDKNVEERQLSACACLIKKNKNIGRWKYCVNPAVLKPEPELFEILNFFDYK